MSSPHLTPAKLLGTNILPPDWAAAQVAFICFTPFPNGFKPYVKVVATERYFLHSPNAEVRLCRVADIPFIVVSEVYGFAVGATTVEELVHYGIKYIIGIGYVGAFNGAPVGQHFIAKDTMSDLPLAAHYGVSEFVHCQPTPEFYEPVTTCVQDETNEMNAKPWGHYTVWNGNSLYRESTEIIQQMKARGCDVVNMDTLSVYAVTPICAKDTNREVSCVYVGTVTDSAESDDEAWDSDLIEAVKREAAHPHDHLVRFMVENVLPKLKAI